MKKVLAVIATILGVLPLLNVNALTESTNYYTYKKGTVVNFYKNEVEENAKNQNSGNTTIVLDDKGANDKYVKVFMVGDTYNKPQFLTDGEENLDAIKQVYISKLRSSIQIEDGEDLYYYTFTDANKGLDFITMNEVLELAGMTNTGASSYTLTNKTLTDRSGAETTLFEAFSIIANSGLGDASTNPARRGFYTSTIAGDSIWAVEFTTTTAGEDVVVTGATLKRVDFSDDESAEYALVGTAYANKTADCHETEFMCYVCGSTYTYTAVGTQDDTCTAVPGITNPADCVAKACYNCDGTYKWLKEGTQDETVCTKVDNVTAEGSCVAAPNTGIESHILEFAIIASLCAIALLAVRRKDLFRTI